MGAGKGIFYLVACRWGCWLGTECRVCKVEVFGFWNLGLRWGREGLVPVSRAYWDLNFVMYGCQFSVRSRSSVGLGAKFSPLVRREVSE